MALTAGQLNETDRKIILRLNDENRATPKMIAEEIDVSREYVSERLTRLREHNLVFQPTYGLYELERENVPEEIL